MTTTGYSDTRLSARTIVALVAVTFVALILLVRLDNPEPALPNCARPVQAVRCAP